jgi:hypothetical protein
VDRVAHNRSDLVEDCRRPGGRNIAARVHRDDLANLALGDRLLGQAVAGVEAADVANLQDSLRSCGGSHDLTAIFDGRRHRLLEKDVLASFEGGDGGLGMLNPTW